MGWKVVTKLYRVPTLGTNIMEPPQLNRREEAGTSGTTLMETTDPPSDGPPDGETKIDNELRSCAVKFPYTKYCESIETPIITVTEYSELMTAGTLHRMLCGGTNDAAVTERDMLN